MQLTKNFTLGEFACHDAKNTPVPKELIPNVRLLAENLQVLRDDIGEPLFVHSGYRTPRYNQLIGGARQSQHPKGKAGDVTAKNFTPKQLYKRAEKLIKAGKMKQGGLGLYAGFIHYDVRGRKARW